MHDFALVALRRLAAFALDWAVVDLAVWGWLEVAGLNYRLGDGPKKFAACYTSEVFLWLMVWISYFGFCEAVWGQGIGKWLLRLHSPKGKLAWLRAATSGLLMQSAALLTIAILLLICDCGSWAELRECRPMLNLMVGACWPLGWLLAALLIGWYSVKGDLANR